MRAGRFARVVAAGEELRVADVAGMLSERGLDIARVPYVARAILENLVRQVACKQCEPERLETALDWRAAPAGMALPLAVSRLVMPDSSGIPVLADLAALRDVVAQSGGEPASVTFAVPAHLVVDHSVQVDVAGVPEALARNLDREFERNGERYRFLKWAQQAFEGIRIVPPGTGIIHQIQVERLACPVALDARFDEATAGAELVIGTDSHTPMVNGIGVIGWGVGGIEAETVLLGDPLVVPKPSCVGVRLRGRPQPGVLAADLALAITELLRRGAPVGAFVEFVGDGASALAAPDRATIANMAPEYGATMGFFPVDEETLRYLIGTGRSEELVELVANYCKEQGLFHTADTPDPEFTDKLELDMSTVKPALAGPKRPQDRIDLDGMKAMWNTALPAPVGPRGYGLEREALDAAVDVSFAGREFTLKHGHVVIAAITSCTNTSNPSVMVGAGLLAKKAVERGLDVKPWVKASMAPGSRVVTRYMDEAGLTPYLEALNFHTVGYGCTTCIGNSGPLPEPISKAIKQGDLVAAAVLSGNRNFEGRVSPDVRANFLASPPLVVAYAIAGTVNIDLATEPLGYDPNGNPVFLRDVWPTQDEIQRTIRRALKPEMFREQYANVFDGNEDFNAVKVAGGELFAWDPNSTYIKEPPFFTITREVSPVPPITGARVLAVMPDSTTTDHISPAGNIARNSPAARYLEAHGVPREEWNSYGSRRGNHEIMMRGTLANIRIKNQMLDGEEGGDTVYIPTMQKMAIWDAAEKYIGDGTPLIVLAGKEYGTGSSRDWAAKGVQLQGVRAVIAESFERIHRSNLVGMGVLPLQFKPGESVKSLGLSGFETYDILGLGEEMHPGQEYTVRATSQSGAVTEFTAISRIDTPVEVNYYKNGGILQTVLRRMAN